jgi:hypothetical protein
MNNQLSAIIEDVKKDPEQKIGICNKIIKIFKK